MNVSFIIPAYNEAKVIAQCLRRLQAICATSACHCEIIVVDNHSTDDTADIAQRYCDQLLAFENSCPAAIRNYGAQYANGDIYIFVDADTVLPIHWLDKALICLSQSHIAACGGPHICAAEASLLQRAWNPTAIKSFYQSHAKLHGCNIAIKAECFKQLQGFDTTLISAEDDDLSQRVIALGHDCVKDSQLAVIHLGYPDSLNAMFKQQVWHGSTQLRAHGYLHDKMVLLTFAWLIGFFILPLSLLSSHKFITPLSLFIIMLIPLLIAKNRNKHRQDHAVRLSILAYIIAYVFIAGRSLGLIMEIIHTRRMASAATSDNTAHNRTQP